jgi:hypothetical protein
LQVYIVKTNKFDQFKKKQTNKKIFFTAIALIVFTGASMANTEEVKEADIVVEKTKPTEPQTEEYEISFDTIWLKAYLNTKAEAMKQLCFMQT